MFYNVVADLPSFTEGENGSNKETIIKELMEENGVQNVQEGINKPSDNNGATTPAKEMNVNGETKPVEPGKKKGGCKC